ncbi:valyl-tRNA synthetase [Peptococcaceae bacterium SCADC1_2_3]|jgi:valyl-tRNA synthetase|nr:valyl-tRNA synthetase [Peptococcaceae bacterium SCADC1_2_3]KFI38154.1 valyl-tRNA synthetase [Peptococcaceae bacterium SCADC1_2_3]HBQ29169.1 valine--tRNA ligase [Desulfotomaculum sp.]HCJ78688.1 valine--tRNA ligase [Desulfotomaculum sp.]
MGHDNLPTTYEPQKVEGKWYRYWEENKFFQAKKKREQKPFCMVMPPPNVTGELHMGHALNNTLQDILIRWRRMQGFNSLWVPGTDHAGIATQAKMEEQLAEEGLSRDALGREEFLARIWAWKEKYGGRITGQLSRLGASCDWQHERFTMDTLYSEAVREVFIRLYEQGLIYRDYYIINWCPRCHTTISDIEVEHKDIAGKLYYFKYPFKDNGGYLPIATTRPETILGDVAVAVNPKDARFRHLIGKTLILPLVGREMPVIADDYVDPSFGTGAVKITPAHDPNDFEVGKRHHLPQVQVINTRAEMTEEAGVYQGLDRWACREKIVFDLKEHGYLIKTEDHQHAVGHCYRCQTVIEPMLSRQWFVCMKPLAQPAIKAVQEGQIRFIPERFAKIYLNWLENIRDWCISRQLWWGHRIPVWYCRDCAEIIVSHQAPLKCSRCAGTNLDQDPDVLDTWFSSALWPFATLGWPQKTVDLAYYYPTSVLVTGRDIIFFWVARMIFSGLAFMGDVPFQEVFIHGLVLDAQGRKMSKSLGNGIDPIEVIKSHGADSLRFMLVTGNTPGNDLRFYFERLEGARNFANKIWNASRFVIMNLNGYQPGKSPSPDHFTLADWWILSRYHTVIKEVTGNLAAYELGEAARVLYEFIWNELCDWYIELAKPRLYGSAIDAGREHLTKDITDRQTAQYVLVEVLRGTLEMLHPFMPFITEEIWQRLPHQGNTIMQAKWPVENVKWIRPQAQAQVEVIMNVVKAIRHIRSEMHIPPGKKAEAIIITPADEVATLLDRWSFYVENLAQCQVKIYPELAEKKTQAAHAVTREVEIFVPLKGLIDLEKETARLYKELTVLEKELARVQDKLKKDSFLTKAPTEIIAKERAKESEFLTKQAAVKERLVLLEGKD